MSRPYSEKFLRDLYVADANQVGVQLGRLCVETNIPATYVAAALGVTRMTVYSWYRGSDIRMKKRKEVEAMIRLLKQDIAAGILPVKTSFDAKLYIESLVGIKL
jgi:hypothetical protein